VAGTRLAAWGLAFAALAAGLVFAMTFGTRSGTAANGCSQFVRASRPARDGFSRSRVEQAFAHRGIQLAWSFQSSAAPSRAFASCHGLLATDLLYSGGPHGPCLDVYLFPEWLGHVPADRFRACGDASGPPAAGLHRGTRIAGSLLVEYTLAPRATRKVQAVLDRLVSER